MRNGPLLAALAFVLSTNAYAAEPPKPIREFIEAQCLDCHDARTARAGFRIDLLTDDFKADNNANLWKEVMDRINSGAMPPKKRPRPDAKEAFAVTSWVAKRLHETELEAQGAGGRVPVRRLNRVEYANTVRDLFALEEGFARRLERELPADGKVGGFDRGAAGLFMDEGQLAQYMTVADLVLDEGIFSKQPEIKKFTYDARRVKFPHGIGVVYQDEAGKFIDDNPTPEFVSTLKEPLSMIAVGRFDEGRNAKEKRYVPHGPFPWTIKNGGIEYLSGGNTYRRPNLRQPFFPERWAREGVTRDGWYRMRINAGAFRGEGAEALKEVRLFVEYGYGSPLHVVKSVVVDAPLDAPKQYEFLMYLQAGPPNMNRQLGVTWDNGDKDVVITNPEYWSVQWRQVAVAGEIERAIKDKKSAEEIAALNKQLDAARAASAENSKSFAGPYWIYDPKLDIAKRPRLWLGAMEWEGPLVEWPPKGRKALFFAGEEREDDLYLREIFTRFLPRAYRRPATAEEVDCVVDWTQELRNKQKLSFAAAVREGVKNVLCSPAFLYLGTEGPPAVVVEKPASGPRKVDDWQLASRLSYFLWSSAPDEELMRLATEKKLNDPLTVRAQVKRMIADPRSVEFVRSFAGQWLGVRNFDNGTPPNRNFYRHYDDNLRDSSNREPLEFFAEVLRKDLPVTNFIDSDFLVINERLAEHYGVPDVEGDHFRRVATPADRRRGGVLGMAAIMTYLADGTRTLPVRRATWVLDTLWNQAVPPPPPNAGDLPVIKDKKLSVRERLSQHRNSENCASCHSRVDPFGLALENFDATGMWRDRQNGEGLRGGNDCPPLDVSGHLPSGREFKSIQEFRAALLAEKDAFLKGFSEKLLCYALGRPIGYGDHLAVEQIRAHAAKHEDRLQEMIQATVAGPYFLTK